MAMRILKNNTGVAVPLPDVSDTVPPSGQLTIATTDYGVYEGSNDVLQFLTDQAISTTVSTLTANDGTFDLGISEGVRLIQGGFSRPIADGADPTIKATVYQRGDGKNALAVDNNQVPGAVGPVPALGPNFTSEDMNVSTGGVARETAVGTGAWVDVYSVLGAGLLLGYLVTLEEPKKWLIRLIIDGNEIYGAAGIKTEDLDNEDMYGFEFNKEEKRSSAFNQGFNLGERTVYWQGPMGFPIAFETSIVIKLQKDTGADKKFLAGLVTRTL